MPDDYRTLDEPPIGFHRFGILIHDSYHFKNLGDPTHGDWHH